ncbi:hypothetical protein LIER_27024 [Lithospermum erythrorhizon]|uniref:Uncharacterized protein n=1 Tax=Lithospermum erythrorhizon TaxID=34254 RepID=A0AAV3RAK1_LITER
MLVQWILNTVDSSLRKMIPYFEEARPLWAVLQGRFNVGSGTRKQHLKTTLAECKQTSTISIGELMAFAHMVIVVAMIPRPVSPRMDFRIGGLIVRGVPGGERGSKPSEPCVQGTRALQLVRVEGV